MLLLLALAATTSALQAPATAPEPRAGVRPVACIYDRLDKAYLSGLWQRTMSGGIPADDPALADFESAMQACQQQYDWPERMTTLAGFYSMARAHGDAMLLEKVPAQADRDLLARAVLNFAPPNLDVLDRDGEGGFASAAKVEFRAFLGENNADLLRRHNYEDLWAAAMPRLIAELMHARFAMIRDLG